MNEAVSKDYQEVLSGAHPQVEVLSTFVADPVQIILRYWFCEFRYEAEFLPPSYGQIFSRLLGQADRSHAHNIHVVLFAVRDLIPEKERRDKDDNTHGNVLEFIKALTAGVTASGGTWIVVRCPDPTARLAEETTVVFEQQAKDVEAQVAQMAGTHYIDASDLCATYGIESCFDPLTDQHAHIPYSDEYYAALGTTIFRAIRARLGQVYKLIVTDCDDTLWAGNCGEVHPNKLTILPHHQWLHGMLLSKKSAGMLLAICSQNNSKDVQRVFSQRQDLGLALTDFTLTKVNWEDKAHNIQTLADELHVALESIIFLDNDPLQRNKVKTILPQVLVPELPATPTEWPAYLKHIWALDTYWVTEEGGRRSSLYRDHAAREQVRASAENLSQFLKELKLMVSIETASEHDIPRLFELLNRVTQFNANGIRPTESDIGELIASDQGEWLVVHVEDRFGDYGQVGAASCRYETDFCSIDSFVLSCRALGRGVEYQMLREIAKRAMAKQKNLLRIKVTQTTRNTPAMEFFTRLGMSSSDVRAGWFQLDASSAAILPDNDVLPGGEHTDQTDSVMNGDQKSLAPTIDDTSSGEGACVLAAAQRVQDIKALFRTAQLIDNQPEQRDNTVPIAPRSDVEKTMVSIFQELLGHDNIGIDDEFLELGGHSLLAMRLLSQISHTFGVDLPMRSLFTERLTIANLASIVEAGSTPEENTAELDTIKQALDSFSDKEIAELFGDLRPSDDSESQLPPHV